MSQIRWTKNRGRNGWDPPLDVGLDESVESVNITLYNGGLGGKRAGTIEMTIVDYDGHNVLYSHSPSGVDYDADLFVVDASTTQKVLLSPSGTDTVPTWLELTLKDNIASAPYNACPVTFNDKVYWAYDSTVNRLHVFNNDGTPTALRRAGLAPFAAAATVADTGAGAYAATLRYYKTRSIQMALVGTQIIRRSEGNDSVSFTPSGAGSAAQITRPTAVDEGETHWEVYGSTDDVTFYGPLATIAIATTTYDDSSTPSTWASTYDAEPIAGYYTPFPSVKFLGTDGKRLYGLGVYETSAGDSVSPKNGRFYYTPVVDSSETHDDERISNTVDNQGFLDLERNTGGVERGISRHPVNNVIYGFFSRGIYGILPTEDLTVPYRRVVLSTAFGAVNNQSLVIAMDRGDRECVYFLDPILGPCVIGGTDGLKWCGKDVKDIWDTFNKDAASVPAWGIWYGDRNQVIFGIATDDSDDPDTILVLDPTEQSLDEKGDLRGGWTTWTGTIADSRCATIFSNTCTSPRSIVKVPYFGGNTGTVLLRYDETATDDNGTAFQAYVTSGAMAQETVDVGVKRAYLVADASDTVAIQQSLVRNFGDEPNRLSTVTLAPEGDETIVQRKFDDAALQDAWALQVTLGDDAAIANTWQLYQYRADLTTGGPR